MSRFGLPQESGAYRALRDELAQAEIALREQREKVAALRRKLPQDTALADDPLLLEGPRDLAAGDAPVREVRLSELVAESEKPVVLLHFMYGGAQTQPCPMCTLWADGYDGIVPHLEQRANFAVFVAGELDAPKSATSRRRVPMSAALVLAIRRLLAENGRRALRLGHELSELLFPPLKRQGRTVLQDERRFAARFNRLLAEGEDLDLADGVASPAVSLVSRVRRQGAR